MSRLILSTCKGCVTDTDLRVWKTSFPDFCEALSAPQTGVKDGTYWVRGGYFNGSQKRADAHLLAADMVILDGDKRIDPESGELYDGAPHPALVHEALRYLNIQHHIYTSHSHDANRNRYRVCVPAHVENQQLLCACVDWLIERLHAEGIYLGTVPENYTWSQPWYYPRVDPDRAALFATYTHWDGEPLDLDEIMREWLAQQPPEPPPPQGGTVHRPDSPIGRFISAHGPSWMLECLQAHGYQFKHTYKSKHGIGYRLLAPESTTGMPGVIMDQNAAGKWTVYSNHGDVLGQKRMQHDAFDLYTLFDHGGDAKAALREFYKGENVREESKPSTGERREPDLNWISDFKLTDAEVSELTDPDWIYENLIIQGHLIAIPAIPGAGKTTIMLQIAGEIAPDYEVCYVMADTGQGEVKQMQAMADKAGFHLLLPDMKAGLSMDDVVNKITAMNELNADYSRYVFIFDTLKKMTDVINKSRAKELYKTLRGLTAKGMTIVLLAHTNKYTDLDGNPIYEGTGDLRSDVDDLIYFIPKKNDDDSLTVSTDPLSATAKRRGTHQPITFTITPDRKVSRADHYIDTAAVARAEHQREKDSTIIEAITEALQADKYRQAEIVDYCRVHHGIGRRSTEGVLRRYYKEPMPLWRRQRAFENNAWLYELVRR